MDLVSMDEARFNCSTIQATLQFRTERDFSSVASDRAPDTLSEEHWNALAAAASTLHQSKRVCTCEELDLVQAREQRHNFDKIILMVNHGEDESQIPGLEEVTDSLTGRGVGQALNLSRRTASFCNTESGLAPELVLVTPSRRVLQTTFLSFPYDTPHQSLRSIPWICYPSTGIQFDRPHSSLADLRREFRGIDYSLCVVDQEDQMANGTSNELLLQRAGEFFQWLQGRDERIIVGTCICLVARLVFVAFCTF
jgi:hypothetical protein